MQFSWHQRTSIQLPKVKTRRKNCFLALVLHSLQYLHYLQDHMDRHRDILLCHLINGLNSKKVKSTSVKCSCQDIDQHLDTPPNHLVLLTFSHHYQASIDLNTANTRCLTGMDY